MKKLYFFLLPFFLLGTSTLFAQPTYTAVTTVDCDAGTVAVDIIVTNFDDITSFQFPITWDISDIAYTGSVQNAPGGGYINPPAAEPATGTYKVSWFTGNAAGIDIMDGTSILTLNYNLVGNAGNAPFVSLATIFGFQQQVTTAASSPFPLPAGAFVMEVDPNPIYIDSTPPTVSCPATINSTSTAVTVPNPTASDNCAVATIINDFNGTSDASGNYPNGTTSVTFTVTDVAGLTNTCSMDVVVSGTSSSLLTITAVPEIVECDDGTVTVDYVVTGFEDMNVIEFAIGFDQTLLTYNTFDATALGFLAGVNSTNAGSGSIDFSWGNLSGTPLDLTDGTTILSITWDLTEFVGSTPITFTTSATNPSIILQDIGGDIDPADYSLVNGSVTIQDNTNPTITCPMNIVQTIPSGTAPATVTVPLPTASDNCLTPTFVNDFNAGTDASGQYPVGTTTVEYTVTDQANNMNTCSFEVTVIESGPLTFNVSSTTIECDGGPAIIEISVENFNQINVTDFGILFDETVLTYSSNTITNLPFANGINITNATNGSVDFGFANFSGTPVTLMDGTVIITLEFNPTGVISGSTPITIGATPTQPLVFENANGTITNFELNPGNIAVEDNGLPTITTCPSDVTIQCGTSLDPASNPLLDEAVATDACNPTGTTVSHVDDLTGLTGCSFTGTVTRTWIADDGNGNTSTCSQIITVADDSPPTFTDPDDITISCSDDFLDLNITGNVSNLADNCSGTFMTTFNDSPDPTTISGCGASNSFVRTWIVQDECDNPRVLTQTITFDDSNDPTFTLPADIAIECDDDITDTGITGVPTNLMDDCGVSAAPTFMDDDTGLTGCNGTGNVIRTWSVTDDCGNTATGTQVIVVQDNTDPTFTVPGDLSLSCEFNPFDLGLTGFPNDEDDNCATGLNATNVDDLSGLTGCNNTGVILRTWTLSDNCGNSSVQTQTITILDDTNPTATCTDMTVALDASGSATVLATDINNGSVDNCAGALTFGLDITTFDCTNLGPNTVVLTVTDACTRTATCSATVTITDDIDPMIVCPNDTTLLLAPGNTDIIVGNIGLVSSSDNCAVDEITYTLTGATTGADTLDASGVTFNEGVTMVTYTVSDAAGNSAQCTVNVSVGAVTLECPADTTESANAAMCSQIINDLELTITSGAANVDEITYTLTGATTGSDTLDASGVTYNVGVTTVTYTVVDINMNNIVCSFDVTITDDEDPTIACPNDTTIIANIGATSMVLGGVAPTVSDNCPDPAVTYAATGATTLSDTLDVSGAAFNIGMTTVTYTTTDAAGNSASCSFNVTVEEVNFDCPNDTTQTAEAAMCSAVIGNIGFGVSSGSAAVAEITYALTGATTGMDTLDASGTRFNLGLTTVTYTITDINMNVSSCSFEVTITDDEDPVLSCPMDTTIYANIGTTTQILGGVAPTVSDNCLDPAVTYTATGATTLADTLDVSGETFNMGLTTVTYTAIDAAGNSATCSFDVTVEPIIFKCPNDTIQTAEAGMCSAIIGDIGLAITSGLDGIAEITYVLSGATMGMDTLDASGERFNVGNTTVTYTVIDLEMNVLSCSFNVLITDDENPTVSCPANQNVSSGMGGAAVVISGIEPTSTGDNCAVTDTTYAITGTTTGSGNGDASGTSFNLGNSTVTYTVTDAAGNTGTCSFTVTVNSGDLLDCPAPISQDNDLGLCSASVSGLAPTILIPGINIDTTYYTLSGATTGSGDGTLTTTTLNVGVTTITYTAIDIFGSSDACSFDVTVNDAEDPTLTCPANVMNVAPLGTTSMVINSIGLVAANDNCAVADTTYNFTGATTGSGTIDVSGSTFNFGNTDVTYTITDLNGNDNSCSFTISIDTIDVSNVITCPINATNFVDAGQCTGTIPASLAPTLSVAPALVDSVCFVMTGATTGTGKDDVSGTTFNAGVTTITYTVFLTDGSTSACFFSVTIEDNIDPILVCPSVDAYPADAGTCARVVTDNLAPMVTDNCPMGVSVTYTITGDTNGGGIGDATGESFNVGSSIITYTATDLGGNTATCTIEIVVNDDNDPLLTCPSNVGVTAMAGQISAVVNNIGLLATTDNCGIIVDTTYILTGATTGAGNSNASGNAFSIGSTNVEYTIEDANGNTQSCTFTVFVSPDGGFNLKECPTVAPLTVDNGQCGAVVNNIAPIILSTDLTLCTYTFTGATSGGGINDASGSFFNVGTTNVEYIGTDNMGNSDTCSFDIIITDNEGPAFNNCPFIVVDTADIAGCRAEVFWNVPTAFDNCGTVTSVTASHMVGDTFNLGSTTITYIATDDSGNTSTCVFDVVVRDFTAPTLNCPADQNLDALAGQCGTIASWAVPVPMDDCGGASIISSSHSSGDFFPVGTTTVTIVAEDDFGNQASCSFDIVVLDQEIPSILGPTAVNGVTYIDDCMAIVQWTDAQAIDNCPGVTIEGTHQPGDTFTIGVPVTVSYIAIDAAGNSNTYSFNFTVDDIEDPIPMNCPMDIVQMVNTPNCEAIVTWTPPTADDCTAVTVTSSASPGQVFPLGGPTIVTYVFTDAYNNSATCSFSVTVVDNQPPVAECYAAIEVGIDGNVQSNPDNVNITTSAGANCDGAIINFPTPEATDNCGPNILGVQTDMTGLSSGSEFPIGTTILEYTFTDAAGNPVTCNLSFTVNALADLVVTSSPNPVCSGSSVQLGTSTIAGATYAWTGPNGYTATVANPTIPNATSAFSGTYTVVCTLPNNCTNTGSVELTVNDGPSITVDSNSPVCDDVISLTATPDGGVDVVTWMWTGPDGTTYDDQNPIIPNATNSDFGTYTLNATGANGCMTTTMVVVSGADIADPTIESDCAEIICLGESCTLFGTQFSPIPDSYTWTGTGASGLPDNTDAAEITVTPTQPGTHTYTYSVILNGCESGVASFDIIVASDPALTDDEFTTNYETELEGSVLTNDDLAGLGFDFLQLTTTTNGTLTTNSDGTFTYLPDPGFIGTDQFTYELCYDCNANLCTTATVSIEVIFEGDCEVPTMITPNDDGVNDELVVNCIETGEFPQNEILIFNQWGDIVYEASPYDNTWNGTFKGEAGKDLPDGTYFVLFKQDRNAVAIQTYITIFR